MKALTLDFWRAIAFIESYKSAGVPISVVMEDPNGNRPVFNRGVQGRRASKIAQNVGANKRDAILIWEYCVNHGIAIQRITPTAKSITKLSSEQFNKITGWAARTSEHARDAAMLVWGM
jgi:hypothetical protein